MNSWNRALAVGLLAAGAIASSGCLVSSFQPLYDDQSLVFDERLIGAWEDREADVSVNVTRGQWRSYAIEYRDRTRPTRFTGFLTELAGRRFLTLRPEDGLERPAYLIASNGIVEVEVTPRQVRARALNYDVVSARLKAGTLKIAAVTDLKQNVVLTADTGTLRKWLAASATDSALFAGWETLTRK